MIQTKHLSKYFDQQQVLFDINLDLIKGKCNLIIGQSGSGKTVLMKCLVGLFKPEEGEILFNGRDFVHADKETLSNIRKEIGMVFQGGALFDSLTVLENVIFPLNMFSSMSLNEKIEQARFCLHRVNLDKVETLLPASLSGGMKKRVAIARAIVSNPKYLFCDEPNSGLDPRTSALIDELIAEITEEYHTTTVINTHDMNSVLQIG
ncbi:MAG: ATP-binding cassette domain-containing protein, partial [Bacteroidales bacterium]